MDRPRACVFILLACAIAAVGYSCEKMQRPAPEVEGMAYVPPGGFYMGSRGRVEAEGVDDGDGVVGMEVGVDELPRHYVRTKGFYMDRYEVTNAEYREFVDSTGRGAPDNPEHPYDPYVWKDGAYPDGLEDNPVVLVSYDDAVAFCRWKGGKRLPTEEEWERACRGDGGRKWPWGDVLDISKTNTRELELKRSVPTGSFPLDASQYGVYDMTGNVREWTGSWYRAYPGSTLERELFGEKFRVIRGASWLHLSVPEGRCSGRGFAPMEVRHRSLGFRCARSVEGRQ